MVCFRYYGGQPLECLAHSNNFPLSGLEGYSRVGLTRLDSSPLKRSNDRSSSESMDNLCFEDCIDINDLSKNVDKCSISEIFKESDKFKNPLADSVNLGHNGSQNSQSDNDSKSLSCVSKNSDECSKSVINEQTNKSSDKSPNIESLDQEIAATSSGVKKKCLPLSNIDGQILNGAKKKVKMNGALISPGSEYYKIWSPKNPCKIMKFVYDNENIVNLANMEESAPPLPPRLVHRPLERSHAISPPQIFRHQKPKKMSKPEDTFNFELIDIDEQFFTNHNDMANGSDFIPGEFFMKNTHAMPLPSSLDPFTHSLEQAAPLATPETDGSLGGDSTSTHFSHKLLSNKRSLDMPFDFNSPLKSKSMLKKNIGVDNYITTVFTKKMDMPELSNETPKHEVKSSGNFSEVQNVTPNHLKSQERAQTNFLENISHHPEFEDENRNQIEIKQISAIKGHKPLSRQTSNASCKASNTTGNLAGDSICLGELAKDGPSTSSAGNTDNSIINGGGNECMNALLDQPHSSSYSPMNYADAVSNGLSFSVNSSHLPQHSSLARVASNGLPKPGILDNGTPKHSVLSRSNLEASNKAEGSPVMRPHPKALARVAGHALQCPPTPTHHARRNRPLPPPDIMRPPGLKANQPEFVASPEIKHADIRPLDTTFNELRPVTDLRIPECMTELRTSEIRSPNMDFRTLGDFVLDRRAPDVRSNELSSVSVDMRVRESRSNNLSRNESNESSSNNLPLPLRHLASTRLPSIPERINRHIPLTADAGTTSQGRSYTECDEPLPPCKYLTHFIFFLVTHFFSFK